MSGKAISKHDRFLFVGINSGAAPIYNIRVVCPVAKIELTTSLRSEKDDTVFFPYLNVTVSLVCSQEGTQFAQL